MPPKQGNKTIQGKSHENHKYNQRKATIQGNKSTKKKRKSTHWDPKTEGALEAHCSGDTRKGLTVDGGRRTSMKKTGDIGPENKHK
jgi:hypothetical protein